MRERPRLLFTGASGFLASLIMPSLADAYACLGVSRSGTRHSACGVRSEALDLCDADAVVRVLARRRPDVVVHAAALADVDACERDPNAAYRGNVLTTANLVRGLAETGSAARLVLISTDQVYDGTGPHGEEDVNPMNVYALTKLWAEDWAERHFGALILRVNFFGHAGSEGRGLASWLARSLAAGAPITLFDDVIFNPLHAAHLGALLRALLESGAFGRVNVGAAGPGLSKADFARRLAAALDLPLHNARIGSADNVALAARRPRDMRMRTERLAELLGHAPPSVEEGIALFADEWRARPTMGGVV